MAFPAEGQAILAIQGFILKTPWSISLVVFLARWFILADLILVVGLLVSRKKAYRHAVLEAAWSFGLALAFVSLLSALVLRDRPFLASPDVTLLIPPPLNTSFPSGHTAAATALAAAFAFVDPIVGVASFLIVALVAFGRMAAGVHYPTDLLGGLIVGLVSFGIVRVVHHALAKKDIAQSAAQHHHDT